MSGYLSRSFSYALQSDDFSWQVSEKSFEDMNILIKEKQILCITFIINII